MIKEQHWRKAGQFLADAAAGHPVDPRVSTHHEAEERPAPIGEAQVVGHASPSVGLGGSHDLMTVP
jgi:hypothetical protein